MNIAGAVYNQPNTNLIVTGETILTAHKELLSVRLVVKDVRGYVIFHCGVE